jgi:hypothetical protein
MQRCCVEGLRANSYDPSRGMPFSWQDAGKPAASKRAGPGRLFPDFVTDHAADCGAANRTKGAAVG